MILDTKEGEKHIWFGDGGRWSAVTLTLSNESHTDYIWHLICTLQAGCVQTVRSTRTAQRARMASGREGVWPVNTPVSLTCSTSPAQHMSPVWLDVCAHLGEWQLVQKHFVHCWIHRRQYLLNYLKINFCFFVFLCEMKHINCKYIKHSLQLLAELPLTKHFRQKLIFELIDSVLCAELWAVLVELLNQLAVADSPTNMWGNLCSLNR